MLHGWKIGNILWNFLGISMNCKQSGNLRRPGCLFVKYVGLLMGQINMMKKKVQIPHFYLLWCFVLLKKCWDFINALNLNGSSYNLFIVVDWKLCEKYQAHRNHISGHKGCNMCRSGTCMPCTYIFILKILHICFQVF